MRPRIVGLTGLLIMVVACPVTAQTNAQLWGNITINWVKNESLTYALDLEPKVLASAPIGDPGWWNVDVTPNVQIRGQSLARSHRRDRDWLHTPDRRRELDRVLAANGCPAAHLLTRSAAEDPGVRAAA